VVRIFVAIGAQVEWDANILRLPIGSVGVAFGALYLGVQAGQRVTGLVVIELGHVDGFPVDEVVAGLAIWAQAAFVKVLVAWNAGRRQTKVGTIQVLILDLHSFLRRHMRGSMALVAFQTRVLAF